MTGDTKSADTGLGTGLEGVTVTGLPRRWALRRGTVGMMLQEQKIQDWLARLAENPEYAAHPLMGEFRALAEDHLKLMRQLTKIARRRKRPCKTGQAASAAV